MENILVGDGGDVDGDKMSLAQVVKTTEANILGSSLELKEIVIESGEMAESLFERVNEGYNELTVSKNDFFSPSVRREVKGFSELLLLLLCHFLDILIFGMFLN